MREWETEGGFDVGSGDLEAELANEEELAALCVNVVGATHVRCFHRSFSRCLSNSPSSSSGTVF